jgi:hypothetical protein
MAFMKLDSKDPNCPDCISDSRVELVAGSPCTIKVHVVLAPPPAAQTFPGASETVTYAALKYADDDGNTATKELGSPTGPAYSTWVSAASFVVTFSAQSWLTSGDFAHSSARLEIRTNQPRTVYQWWTGVVP